MKTVIVTSQLNTTVVRRGESVEVDATPQVMEMISSGVLIDVTPKPKRPKPKPKPEESDAVEDLG